MKLRVWLSKALVRLLMVVLPLKSETVSVEEQVGLIKLNRKSMSDGDMSKTTNFHYPFGGQVYEVSLAYGVSNLYANATIKDVSRLDSLLDLFILEAYRVKTLMYIEKKLKA